MYELYDIALSDRACSFLKKIEEGLGHKLTKGEIVTALDHAIGHVDTDDSAIVSQTLREAFGKQ